MTIRRRSWWLFSMLAFSLSASGCATSNLQSVNLEIDRDGSDLNNGSGQRINGYLLLDGTKVEYKGWAKIAGEDSIRFWSNGGVRLSGDKGFVEMTDVPGPVYALDSVVALDIVSESAGAEVALFGLIVLGGLLVAAAISFSSDPPHFQ